jgi:hypothetical protein
MRKMCIIIIIYECHGQKIVRGRPALSKNIDSLKFYFHLSIDMAIFRWHCKVFNKSDHVCPVIRTVSQSTLCIPTTYLLAGGYSWDFDDPHFLIYILQISKRYMHVMFPPFRNTDLLVYICFLNTDRVPI